MENHEGYRHCIAYTSFNAKRVCSRFARRQQNQKDFCVDYNKDKEGVDTMRVFVAGPRAVKALNRNITDVLSRMIEKQLTVLLGDAAGVDRLVQEYFAAVKYPNVSIYASDGKARNNVGGWPVHKVEVPVNAKGFDFYAQKDIQMAQDADTGFMIWNGKSKGTLNNMINLTAQNKRIMIYLIPAKKMFCVDRPDSVRKLAQLMGPETFSLHQELCPKSSTSNIETSYEQLSLSETLK